MKSVLMRPPPTREFDAAQLGQTKIAALPDHLATQLVAIHAQPDYWPGRPHRMLLSRDDLT